MRRAALLLCLALAGVLPVRAGSEPAQPSDNPERFHVVVSFGSQCCGPDVHAIVYLARLVHRVEMEKNVRLTALRQPWGPEGDHNVCLRLDKLDVATIEKFTGDLKRVMQRRRAVVQVNAECVPASFRRNIGYGPATTWFAETILDVIAKRKIDVPEAP
jgi:hypothetical protein